MVEGKSHVTLTLRQALNEGSRYNSHDMQEQRLKEEVAKLERTVKELQTERDSLYVRINDLQAKYDHLSNLHNGLD